MREPGSLWFFGIRNTRYSGYRIEENKVIMVQASVKKELKVTLEDILLSQGVVTGDQIKQCETEQLKSDFSIEQIILNKEFATRRAIANALGSYYDAPYVDLDNYDIDTKVLKLVSERLARKYKFLPLFKIINNLTITILIPGICLVLMKSGICWTVISKLLCLRRIRYSRPLTVIMVVPAKQMI